MLHFFPRYARDATDTPFARELRRIGVAHRIFRGAVNLRYRSRLGQMLRVYPRLICFALNNAVRSLLLARPRPEAVIIGTDVEALVFGAIKWACHCKTRIIFETFILTPRSSAWCDALHRRYFRVVLAATDMAICHSSAETARYHAAFPRTRCRFRYVPFGTNLGHRAALLTAAQGGEDRPIVTAGRSGRDYAGLAAAIAGLPCRLHIICDIAGPLAGLPATDQISVLDRCFDEAYLAELASALFVVVPLSVDDISAGQMVLLQAAALRRAVIITRTSTTHEYATDEVDALLVPRGDIAALRAAIIRLLEDSALRTRLGAAAAARFDRDHSTEAYTRNLVAAVQNMR